MTEENQVVEQEAPQQEKQEDTQNQTPEQPQEVEKRNVDHNWDQVRQVLQAQKQEIEELKNRLSRPVQEEEKDEFAELDQEEYLTVGKAREMAEKLAEKKAEKTARRLVQEYAQEQQVANDEQRARSKYDDYDYVIENFAIPAIKNDPALAYKIKSSKNPAEVAYKIGKLSDDYEESSMKRQPSPKAEKVLKNVNRPVSSSAITSSLKGQADDFSKLSKQQIWEMADAYAKKA